MNNLLSKVQLLPLYVVLGYTMGLPGMTKIFDGERVMGKYVELFSNTFVAKFPGTPLMIYLLGIMELAVAGLLFISIARREFLPGHAKTWLRASLFVALVTFAALGFGLRLIENHDGAASQYFYFGMTLLMYWWVGQIEVEKQKTH